MSEVRIFRDAETNIPEIHREGYEPVSWDELIAEFESRIYTLEHTTPHDHSVLADAINALVERVTALEDDNKKLAGMFLKQADWNTAMRVVSESQYERVTALESQPPQLNTPDSTGKGEGWIPASNVVWRAHRNRNTGSWVIDTQYIWNTASGDYIRPYIPGEPAPAAPEVK